MSTRRLLHHTLRQPSLSSSHRHYAAQSSAVSATRSPSTPSPSPSPPPPDLMVYDRLAESVKSKLKRLETPDPRFLRYTSPHPISLNHSEILKFPETKITSLPNGLRVVTESNLAARSAAFVVTVDSGSRYEKEETNGVGNFVKEMALRGENEEAANIGAELDAATSREMSKYSARVTSRNSPKGVEVLGKIFQDLDFSDERIEKVRDAIIRHNEKMSAEGDQIIFDQLHATAFQYTPLGRTVHGPLTNIKSINKADIQDYISSHYAAHRMVISASGAVKHEDVVEQVRKVFTKLSANPATTSQLVSSDPAYFTGSEQ